MKPVVAHHQLRLDLFHRLDLTETTTGEAAEANRPPRRPS
jgi:hypothetical protein